MYICPLCNQLQSKTEECPKCQHVMDDRGRVMDYFDDYSAYLDINGMKKSDGFAEDNEKHQCPHIFYCTYCHHNKVLLVNEKEM